MTTEQKLWKAILELDTLLRENINEEEKYQKYFEENPLIFYILGLDVVESFEKKSKNKLAFDKERNFRPEPDFIGINKNSKIVRVIDIKTPFVEKITTSRSSDSNRAKFDAETEKYISQVTEYIDSIKENPESREMLKALFREKRFSFRIVIIYKSKFEICFLSVNNLIQYSVSVSIFPAGLGKKLSGFLRIIRNYLQIIIVIFAFNI